MSAAVRSILFTTLIVGAIFAVPLMLQRSQIRTLQAELEAAREQAAAAESPARSTADAIGSAETESGAAAAEGSASLAAAEGESAGEQDPADAGAANPMASMGEMLKNPAARQMMKQQFRMMIDGMYGPMIDDLGLPEDVAEQLKNLLVDRQLAITEAGAGMFDKDRTQQERDKLQAEVKQTQENYEGAIRELIGEEAYEEFELYEKSQNERMELASYKDALTGKGLSLTESEESQLMAIMYEERQNSPELAEFEQNEFPDEGFTEEFTEKTLREMEEVQARIRERAAQILSEEQLEVFLSNQENYRNMIDASLKMARGMFGNEEVAGEE